MLRKALVVLIGIVLAFYLTVALQPSEFRIERSVTIAAPAPVVFAHVNDFHQWAAWSPWEKLDPAMQRTYTGAPAGTGATYAWAGNEQVGEGQMTILESQPAQRITIKLEFLKPYEATNTAIFDFAATGDTTTVTWSMSGQNNFMSKAFGLFMNMDKLVGGDFERGLAALKTVAEAELAGPGPDVPPPSP